MGPPETLSQTRPEAPFELEAGTFKILLKVLKLRNLNWLKWPADLKIMLNDFTPLNGFKSSPAKEPLFQKHK